MQIKKISVKNCTQNHTFRNVCMLEGVSKSIYITQVVNYPQT